MTAVLLLHGLGVLFDTVQMIDLLTSPLGVLVCDVQP